MLALIGFIGGLISGAHLPPTNDTHDEPPGVAASSFMFG